MPFSSRVRFMLTSSKVICKQQFVDMAGQEQLATSMQKHSLKNNPMTLTNGLVVVGRSQNLMSTCQGEIISCPCHSTRPVIVRDW